MTPEPSNADRLDRIVNEILDRHEVCTESAGGPEGPWFFKSIRVARVMNTIRIYDVDGQLFEVFTIDDITDPEQKIGPFAALRRRLERAHARSLDEL